MKSSWLNVRESKVVIFLAVPFVASRYHMRLPELNMFQSSDIRNQTSNLSSENF